MVFFSKYLCPPATLTFLHHTVVCFLHTNSSNVKDSKNNTFIYNATWEQSRRGHLGHESLHLHSWKASLIRIIEKQLNYKCLQVIYGVLPLPSTNSFRNSVLRGYHKTRVLGKNSKIVAKFTNFEEILLKWSFQKDFKDNLRFMGNGWTTRMMCQRIRIGSRSSSCGC